jgi:2-oxoglutarate dehydrogenase E1 component
MARIPAKILRIHVPGATLADALPHLQETYCGTIAYEIEHISSHRQRTWLRQKVESGEYRQPLTNEEARELLRRLTMVDTLERFMHKAYLGQKQFSIEGLDMTVPMLDEMIQLSATQGAREVVIGMAHRGRLNVLAHNLGRQYETIFREFEGASDIEAVTDDPPGRDGRRQVSPRRPGQLPARRRRIDHRAPRVEPVAPRVRLTGRDRRDARDPDDAPGAARAPGHGCALPIILHGDAAFPGQGVVAET